MKKYVFGSLLGVKFVAVVTLLNFSSCASKLDSFHNDQSFQLLSSEKENFPRLEMAKFMMEKFQKELNLTEEQKSKINELRKEAFSRIEDIHNKNKGLRDNLKNAFLADNMDKSNLEENFKNIKAEHEKNIDFFVEHIIKVSKVLTKEQKDKISSKISTMQEKMSKFHDNNFFNKFREEHKPDPAKMISKMKSELNLTNEQETKLKEVFAKKIVDPKVRFENIKDAFNKIHAELKSENPDPEKIKSVINDKKKLFEEHKSEMLDRIVSVHDILTTEQRKNLVSKLESKHNSIMSKIKSHFFNK
ncbi:MAG: Spy/CpxP family protein refolding chaperone [Candidatus Sericytochromatia bacterium]